MGSGIPRKSRNLSGSLRSLPVYDGPMPESHQPGKPNFTVILPGGCNARCPFCYWSQRDDEITDSGAYADALKTAIERLPKEYRRVTLTGGEPTLSPHLGTALDVLRKTREWEAVVLTTNGTGLNEYIDHAHKGNPAADHVNISRHAATSRESLRVFGAKNAPSDSQLRTYVSRLNETGVDVTLNCVLHGQFTDVREEILEYVDNAKKLGASQVVFRSDQKLESTAPPYELKAMGDWKVITRWSCDACMVWRQVIHGMPVFWKASVSEPSVTTGYVYELVLQPNGQLTVDWAGEKPYEAGGEGLQGDWSDILPSRDPVTEERGVSVSDDAIPENLRPAAEIYEAVDSLSQLLLANPGLVSNDYLRVRLGIETPAPSSGSGSLADLRLSQDVCGLGNGGRCY